MVVFIEKELRAKCREVHASKPGDKCQRIFDFGFWVFDFGFGETGEQESQQGLVIDRSAVETWKWAGL
jgi:hypothetical protein